MYSIIFLLVTFCLQSVFSYEWPSDIEKCRFGDTKCLAASMNAAIRLYKKSLPAFGLHAIDAIKLPDCQLLNDNRGGPIWFTMDLRDQCIYGFENTTITKVVSFERDPSIVKTEIYGKVPSLVHKAIYDTLGRVLLFKINSTNYSVSDFQNFQFVVKLKLIPEYRLDKRFMKVYQLTLNVEFDRWILDLKDYYNENSDLTIATNRLFNEHF